VLGELCEVIVEPLRDRVVLGLLHAALVRCFHDVGFGLLHSCIAFAAKKLVCVKEEVRQISIFYRTSNMSRMILMMLRLM
jgi:hypothetical protein